MYTASIIDYNSTPGASTPTISKKELYIYDPIGHDEGLIVVEPILNLEASKAGNFSCTLPETNYGYGRIIRGLTRMIVRKDNRIIFMGRVSSEERDLYLNQKIMAEGSLAYLADTVTDKKIFTDKTLFEIVSYILNYHNNKFPNEPWKRFYITQTNCQAAFVGRDNSDVTSDKISLYSINYDYTFDCITDLLGLANAVLKTEYNETTGSWDVYIYNKYNLPTAQGQPIEFGVNLLDLIQSYDHSDICTAVIPFGGDALQTSKEIGEVVAGGTDAIYDYCMWRGPDDYDYNIYSAGEYSGEGYWAFAFDIGAYNAAHPETPIKRLYLSWRAYKFTTENGYVADNAWRIYERIWDTETGRWVNQTLGFHEITAKNEGFESAVNEMIDLTDPQYSAANYIMMGGWGGLIKPLIRRDAIVVEENDRLNISGCSAYGPDEQGLRHPAGSLYLYSDTLIQTYGLIEKKLEYDIEDKPIPLESYTPGHLSPYGGVTQYDNTALGYKIEYDGEEADYETYRGLYQIIPFAEGYTCIEYELPSLGDPKRPRGLFITSRMHEFGSTPHAGDEYWINGIYVLLDDSHQVLSYKEAQKGDKGSGFTSIQREYIDLSEASNFGAKWVRVGGYTGGGYPLELYPSDDNYSRDRLMDQAKLYITEQQWEKIVIEATAVDLSIAFDEWASFELCTAASVYSSFHGLATTLPISALTIGLDDKEYNTIKLGYDSDEYLTAQLTEKLRLSSINQSK